MEMKAGKTIRNIGALICCVSIPGCFIASTPGFAVGVVVFFAGLGIFVVGRLME
jgi:hypothetical protein